MTQASGAESVRRMVVGGTMKKIGLTAVLILVLALVVPLSNVYGQQEEEEPEKVTIEDLERELNKTLKSVRNHYEDVQENLDEAGVGRDPDLDEAIKELEQEQQSTMETFEGLGSLLLKIHGRLKKESDEKSQTTLQDVEGEFSDALMAINEYIEQREEYWAGREVDSDTQLEEELRQLQEDQEFIEGIVEDLAAVLSDAWKEVIAEWGDALKAWEDMVRDMYGTEE